MKFTYPIRDGHVPALIGTLSDRFGCPRSFEELVIYDHGEAGTRVAITRDKMRVSWGLLPQQEGLRKRQKQFSMSTDTLKDKLDFIFDGGDHECEIGICSVLQFFDKTSGTVIGFRKETFVGPILSFEIPDKYRASNGARVQAEAYFHEFSEYLTDDLRERIDAVSRTIENCFMSKSGKLSLSPRIADFCGHNGIVNPLGRPFTYKELQDSKSNDYSKLEGLYRTVAGHELLSQHTAPSAYVVEESVSIIIPCFNTAKTIGRVLRGIKGQSLELIRGGVEVILVDDGSAGCINDTVSKLAAELDIQIIRLEINSGVSCARQMGLAYASGDIVIFIDSDIVLSENYIYDHAIRNSIIGDAIFVSFKSNVPEDFMVDLAASAITLGCPDFSADLRVSRLLSVETLGIDEESGGYEINILEESNYFKEFHGSRVFGVFGLASMIIGHNFSGRRETFLKADPFSRAFRGWGMEDVYLGLRAIASGMFLIPVLSSGVYHISHPVRSGSDEAKQQEFERNQRIIADLLTQPADRKFERRDAARFQGQAPAPPAESAS